MVVLLCFQGVPLALQAWQATEASTAELQLNRLCWGFGGSIVTNQDQITPPRTVNSTSHDLAFCFGNTASLASLFASIEDRQGHAVSSLTLGRLPITFILSRKCPIMRNRAHKGHRCIRPLLRDQRSRPNRVVRPSHDGRYPRATAVDVEMSAHQSRLRKRRGRGRGNQSYMF